MLVVSKHVYHSNLHKITPKNNESTEFYSTQEYVSAKKSQHLTKACAPKSTQKNLFKIHTTTESPEAAERIQKNNHVFSTL